MKKIYVLLVVCIGITASLNAQTYYWIGPVNGVWSNGANWSLSSGGAPAGAFPQDNTDDAIIDVSGSINLDVSLSLNRLSVEGVSTVAKITGKTVDQTLTVLSTNLASPGLNISTGCKLEHDADNGTWFQFIFGDDAKGNIDGDWYFAGDVNNLAFASFFLGDAGFDTELNINSGGSITISPNGFIEPNETTGDDYLMFNAGSTLKLLGDAPIVPAANYNAASIIEITGVVNAGVTFEETGAVGTINYNCPAQSNGSNPLYLSLLTFEVAGSLNIYSTNDNELALLSYNSTVGLPSRDATIKGNLNIQDDSKVAIAHNDGPELPNNLHVEGNVIANGTSLSLQTSSFISSAPTTLYVKGNIQHTLGTFNALSGQSNETAHLFVIEMNGTTAQTISSHNGTFDNDNNQVTLRINNAAGVSLLTSLQIGRLSFNSANKGIVTTGINVLTINNTTPGSVSALVVETPSAQGFVNGIARRRSASTEPTILPVGAGSLYRAVTLVPSGVANTTFEARFINSAHGGTVQSPVLGIAPYYWEVARIGAGADAAVQLGIPAQIPGAAAGNNLAVARFNSTSWVSAKGSTGVIVTPGTASSGTVRSEVQTSFGFLTISYESDAALPTYLVSFDAKKYEKESALLSWKITHNSTPERFDIMRSGDGRNFEKIGSIAGNDELREYAFTDQLMLQGDNYYRLKMADKDGVTTFSTIILLSNNRSGVRLHSMTPTLVRDMAKLKISSSLNTNMQVIVTDMYGRVLQTQMVKITDGNQDVWLNAAQLTPGVFQVTAIVSGIKSQTLRFIKL